MSLSAVHRRKRTNVMIPDHVFGALVFVFVEIMFYSALLSSFFVMRRGRESWGQTDALLLPKLAEGFNGIVLALSVGSVFLSLLALKKGSAHVRGHVMRAFMLGLLFTVYQIVLGAKLVAAGVTLTSSVFSGTLYLLLGSHLLQAAFGTTWLARIWIRLKEGNMSDTGALRGLSVLWGFLFAVWTVIYAALFF